MPNASYVLRTEKSREVIEMKKIVLLLAVIGLLSAGAVKVGAQLVQTPTGYYATDTSMLNISLVNQDPYPAEPGGYVDLLFTLENWGTDSADNVAVELLPAYPFSLDPGTNATKVIGTIKGFQTDEKAVQVDYKVRVDKDAVDGTSEIKVRYTYDSGTSVEKTFDVSISNPRTDFDVVVQDITSPSVTLAIANIGANDGYAVIVGIPDQKDFRATGTSRTILGNLNAGDYTLATFQVIPVNQGSNTGIRNLTVEISYTDALGIRRTVDKDVRLDMTPLTNRTFARSDQSQFGTSSSGNGLIYIGIGTVGIVAIAAFFILRKRKGKKE
jgi:hypothetical protein